MLPGIRIRHKLLLSYSLLFFCSLLITFTVIYTVIRNNITKNIDSELTNTTTAIYNLVKACAAVSTKNYLRAAAEKNLEIVAHAHAQFKAGKLSEKEAKELAEELLLSQTIGQSGYIYCLDSTGTVVAHPHRQLLRSNVSEFQFVRDQMKIKRGYMEYDWKNPEETTSRPKALYMVHFKPWDWIISVSAYRSEFKNLVNIDDFKKSVLDLHFGKTGYSFVVKNDGTAIIHPKIEGFNILNAEGLSNESLREMFVKKNGSIIYPWKNPGEKESRLKLCIFNYIEGYDWIVGSASYLDEFYGPLHTLGIVLISVFGITLFLVLPLSFTLSNSITKPLQQLMQHFSSASKGDFNQRMPTAATDEIGQLAVYFNSFMTQLEEYSSTLKQEIAVRREAENNLRESEERYRSVMEAAADPIVIYDTGGRVTYFNPAFHRVFGWSLDEKLGQKMDHFVPEENWPETNVMISAVLAGEVLPATETRRYTKDGNIINVSISGAAYRGHDGELAGSIIILRDITDTKRLTRLLMDIGDNVRQTMGQNLHDDLCPHLIGIAGLTTVLKDKIEKENDANGKLAARIIALIEEATNKARGLARGLCPVHLVSHGLQAALGEICTNCTMTSGISCIFSGDERLMIKDNALATHLYYIAQEAVNNAVKHSGATSIIISLQREDDYLHLRITDNGSGMDDTKSDTMGIGLQIMRYRVLVIGAFLDIITGKTSGTTIHVLMKLPE